MKAVPIVAAIAALALSAAPHRAPAQALQPRAACADGARLNYICGLKSPEDLVQVPGTSWILVSGLGDGANPASTSDSGGELALIDPATRTARKLSFARGAARTPYDGCSAAPDPAHLLFHGLSIQPRGAGLARLFAVGHGGREAIEVFEVASAKGAPTLTWIGCVPAPPGAYDNSVAALKDGRLVITDFLHKPTTVADLLAGRVTGAVYLWKPGGKLEKLPETDLSGANGVEVTPDGRYMFVAVSGLSRVMRFELADTARPPTVIDPAQQTDNIRWGPGGKLLLAGPDRRGCKAGDYRCGGVLTVVALDPKTLAMTTLLRTPPEAGFTNLSSALLVGKTLWLGSPVGERVGYTAPDR